MKLHPSGWLSVEDRSISFINRGSDKSMTRQLYHRRRYMDYFITGSSICQPWSSEGVITFHFSIDGVLLLGSSAIGKSANQNNHRSQKNELLFAVDELSGGSLPDGFEWMSAISNIISSSKTMHDNLFNTE